MPAAMHLICPSVACAILEGVSKFNNDPQGEADAAANHSGVCLCNALATG